MIIIGLTGSIAMGKSEVSQIFQSQGIPVFDADKAVHALYESERGIELLKPFAAEAIVNGKVHRPTLSALVQKDSELLNHLEKIVHTEVAKQRLTFKTKAEQLGQSLIAYDIPLLFEKQTEKSVDVTVVVSAPFHLQQQRAFAREGMTPEKLRLISSRQMPDAEKRQRADYIIENDGTLGQLKNRTIRVLNDIKKAHNL